MAKPFIDLSQCFRPKFVNTALRLLANVDKTRFSQYSQVPRYARAVQLARERPDPPRSPDR